MKQPEFREIVSHRWHLDRFKEVRVDPDRVQEACAVSPDLNWLALVRANHPAQVCKVSERTLRTLPITSGPYAFAVFSPDSKLLALPLSGELPQSGRRIVLRRWPCGDQEVA